MDSTRHFHVLMDAPATARAQPEVLPLLAGLLDAAGWLAEHAWLLAVALVLGAVVTEMVVRQLAKHAGQERIALELVPARDFDPSAEEILRRGIELARASTTAPWWAPRRTKAVRIRLRAAGRHPLIYRIEGPAGATRLLSTTPFGPHVQVRKAGPLRDKSRQHEVRAEMILRGNPVAALRDVPLEPDPLQPLVDAVADLRADLGDLAEVSIDLQRAPKTALRARRWRAMETARRSEQRELARAARSMHRDSARWDDSVLAHLQHLVTPGAAKGGGPGRRVMMPPAPQRIDREEALGKLAEDTHLVRVQILVRCASNVEGRAQARLARLQAAFDAFGGGARWAMRGLGLGPWRLGADRWPHRAAFERRWHTGQCQPPPANWVALPELAGLLKPPTRHCRLPVLPAELPTWQPDDPELLLQGWYQEPGGARRLVATPARDTLFEIGSGQAGGGKTERAVAQSVGYAHAGGGLLFIDPHRDSWQRAAPFLAHAHLADRIARIDLRGYGANPPVAAWNPLGMHHRPTPARHEVVEGIVDAFSSSLGWDNISAPRALTIFTEALTVLAAVNETACRAERPDAQSVLFHLRPLLADPDFRTAALTVADPLLDDESRAWWRTVFPTLPPEAFNVLFNPLSRLAANPTTRAFLGQPEGRYDIRAAMDHRMIVWVCTAGTGPTDRLLVALLTRDLLRAGRSRADTPAHQRVRFRAYLDELITLTGAAPDSIAAMFEDLRKYEVQVHGMTQLLGRLPAAVRASMMQNASTLSTTRGSRTAVTPVTDEWGAQPSPEHIAHLDRYVHYSSLTVGGRRVGPLRIEGPHLDDVFADLARPRDVPDLEQAADRTAGAAPRDQLVARAADQYTRVAAFLTDHLAHHGPAGSPQTVRLSKNGSFQ